MIRTSQFFNTKFHFVHILENIVLHTFYYLSSLLPKFTTHQTNETENLMKVKRNTIINCKLYRYSRLKKFTWR